MTLPPSSSDVNQPDRLEELSRTITLLAFAITLFAMMAAPLLALQWRQMPFPGLMTNPHLIVNGRIQPDWPGRQAGIKPSTKIIRVAGVPVFDNSDYRTALASQEVGDVIPVFTRAEDGSVQLFPEVELVSFQGRDFASQFWLPYLVGLAYFVIALWVYGTSGSTRPGRALAFFCVSVAVSVGLLFEVTTSHWMDPLWIFGLSALGGALISLSLRFPVEWQPVRRWPWVLAIPYLISIGLGLWGLWTLQLGEQPWQFLRVRSTAYLYTTFGAVFFFGVTFARARTSTRASVRRQARLVLFGSLIAFLPMISWFLAPLIGVSFPFNSILLLPGLLLFPLTVATAILRYRLLEIDTLVNRAIVYGILTAALAGVIAATTGLSQRLFIVLTGERSDLAIVITTLIVVSAITPIKNRVQGWVDRQFREMPAAELRKFGEEVENHIRLTDPELLGQHLVEQAATTLKADSAALYLDQDGKLVLKHIYGNWRGAPIISVPIHLSGERVGILQLSKRRTGRPYQRYEVESLAQVSQRVGQIMAAGGAGSGQLPSA